MQITRLGKYSGVVVFALALFTCGQLLAGVTASISGTVTDASGAVVAGATVTATNVETAWSRRRRRMRKVLFLPIAAAGKVHHRRAAGWIQDLHADGSGAGRELGARRGRETAGRRTSEKVEVSSAALHVDTEARRWAK